ncbi:MAG: hypothetical protein ACM3TR_19190, partial [Caulobacteraceae bacterium]
MKKIVTMLILVSFLLTGCTIKQGHLVVLENDNQNEKTTPDKSVYEHLNFKARKYPVDKYSEAVKKIDPKLIPLTVSPDYRMVFAFEFVNNPEFDLINSKTVTGNMIQEISLQVIDTEKKDSKVLGKFPSIKDFRFDETGKLLSFIDGTSNIYVYDTTNGQLQKIISGDKRNTYDSVSWSMDSKRLMINTRMEFDIASKEFISIAVDSYTPFIKTKLDDKNYIVQMKNKEYNDMIAFYDFTTKSYTSIANGIYMDSDDTSLVYTKDFMYGLNIVNLKTLESKTIENGPIYSTYIAKSSGDIFYTTLNSDPDSRFRYVLVKVNPDTLIKTPIKLNSPTFYLSPAEDKLYIVSNYGRNSVVADTRDLRLYNKEDRNDDADLFGIKSTILKMYQLDYKSSDSYERYEERAKEIYINTYVPIPQEALENKLIDYKRFNMPLPAHQKESYIPPTITFKDIKINGGKASVNLGLFYINSIELVKYNDKWYITGFTTHPDSKEVKDINSIVQKQLND